MKCEYENVMVETHMAKVYWNNVAKIIQIVVLFLKIKIQPTMESTNFMSFTFTNKNVFKSTKK